jgi:hypothetical protein
MGQNVATYCRESISSSTPCRTAKGLRDSIGGKIISSAASDSPGYVFHKLSEDDRKD